MEGKKQKIERLRIGETMEAKGMIQSRKRESEVGQRERQHLEREVGGREIKKSNKKFTGEFREQEERAEKRQYIIRVRVSESVREKELKCKARESLSRKREQWRDRTELESA